MTSAVQYKRQVLENFVTQINAKKIRDSGWQRIVKNSPKWSLLSVKVRKQGTGI